MKTIILASQSRQRQDLFATLNLPFTVVPANLDEQAITAPTQLERAEKVARAKAETAQVQYPQAIVIAADTYVVSKEGRVLEKPQTLDEAKDMLAHQSGKQSQELTGFCYLDPEAKINFSTTVMVEVTFRQLSQAEIEHYVSHEPVLTWSGAFCPAYTTGMALIESINGSFTSFSHGLPLELVTEYLQKSGISF